MKFNQFTIVIVSVLYLLVPKIGFGQTGTVVRYMRIPQDHRIRIIEDNKKKIKYILDTSHIYIEAIDRHGVRIWKTDPWKDAKIKAHMDERPIVISFLLRNDSSTSFKDVLAIDYDNKGGAIIDAKTGAIKSIGQD